MRVSRGKASSSSDITVNEDLDFLTLYKLLRLAAPASGGALRKGNKDIANAEVSNTAAIAYSKLNLALGIKNADVAAAAAIVYSKLNLTGAIKAADIEAAAGIPLSKLEVAVCSETEAAALIVAYPPSMSDTWKKYIMVYGI